MNEEKIDLRVVKTHKTIRNALIELLDEIPFDKIAVQDILDRALVNRSTFYKYYSGKSDLAGKMIADFKAEYTALLQKRFSSDMPSQVLDEMSQTLFALRRTVLALWKIHTKRHHLYQDMFRMIEQNYLKHVAGSHGDLPYQAHLAATLALTTAKYYFEQNQPVDPKKIRKDILQMIDVLDMKK